MNLESLPRVQGDVVYLARMDEKPHTYAYDLPPGVPRTNMLPDGDLVGQDLIYRDRIGEIYALLLPCGASLVRRARDAPRRCCC